MRNTLLAATLLLATIPSHSQIACPITWVRGESTQDTIHLDFMNKGKAPIRQIVVTCSPPLSQSTRTKPCRAESGLFYPGMQYTLDIPYPGASRHPVTIALKAARIGDGRDWSPSGSDPCQTIRVTRKKS